MARAGNVYLRIARLVLDERYDELSVTIRQRIMDNADYEYLEAGYVHGHEAISAAVIALRKALAAESMILPRGFTDYVKYGMELQTSANGFSLETLREEVESLTEEKKTKIVMEMMRAVHDGWARANAERYFEPYLIDERYKFMPMELIGYGELEKDYIFVGPIAEEIGLEVSRRALYDEYIVEVVKFRHEHEIKSKNRLIDWTVRKTDIMGHWVI